MKTTIWLNADFELVNILIERDAMDTENDCKHVFSLIVIVARMPFKLLLTLKYKLYRFWAAEMSAVTP